MLSEQNVMLQEHFSYARKFIVMTGFVFKPYKTKCLF